MSAALPVVPPWDYASEPKEAVSECNLCGGKVFCVMATRDRYGLPQETDGCLTCGLLFLNPRMTPEAYSQFYAEGHYRELLAGFRNRPYDEGRVRAHQTAYGLELAAFVAAKRKPGQRTVLDIGGAPGTAAMTFAQVLQTEQPLVVDPAPCIPGVRHSPRTFEDYATDEKFDFVLMCQTVDHLLDLRGSLEKVHGLLADGGLFFVDVSELRRSLKFFGGGLFNVVKVDHPYCLAEEVMEYALGLTGFRVIRKTYAMTAWHVGYLCEKTVPYNRRLPSYEVAALLREVRR